jgi:hypothetical protein
VPDLNNETTEKVGFLEDEKVSWFNMGKLKIPPFERGKGTAGDA